MRNFEQHFKFGMAHREGTHVVLQKGYAFSKSEKEYLAEAMATWIKSFKENFPGKKVDIVECYLSAFVSGITYSGCYFGPGAPEDENTGSVNNITRKTN